MAAQGLISKVNQKRTMLVLDLDDGRFGLFLSIHFFECGCPTQLPFMFTFSGFPWKNQGQPLSKSPFSFREQS